MYNKLQTRKDQNLSEATSNSQAELIQQLVSEMAKLHDLIVEKDKELTQKDQKMGIFQKQLTYLNEQIDKQTQLIAQLTKQLEESKAREQKMIDSQEKSNGQQDQILEAQKESKSMIATIQKYTKPTLYTAMGSTLLGDLIIDFYKEVAKKTGEKKMEALVTDVQEVLGPLSSVAETIATNFPTFLLIIKAAIITLMIAAPILNLTVSAWTALREGLAKFRSRKASK